MPLALLLSVVLHGLLVFSMRVWIRDSNLGKSAPAPVYVELHDLPLAQPNFASQEAGKNRANGERFVRPDAINSNKPLELGLNSRSNLADQWQKRHLGDGGDAPPHVSDDGNGIGGGSGPRDPSAKVGPAGEGWSQATQYALGMGLEFTNETAGFFQALHRRVDGMLVYPDDLAYQRIQGGASVNAEISRDGRLIRFLSMSAESDILQAFAMTTLILALEKPLPEAAWLESESAFISFEFEFRANFEGNATLTLPVGVEKNRLLFARQQQVPTWITEKWKELVTRYVPPVIIFPGGFYIDLVHAYYFIKDKLDDAPLESEARRARIETLHEELRHTIKKRETPRS